MTKKEWLRTLNTEPKFSNSWFWTNAKEIRQLLIDTDFCGDILEIGAFEGQATLWFKSMLPCTVHCVDPFEQGSVENLAQNDAPSCGLLQRFTDNLAEYIADGTVTYDQQLSSDALPKLLTDCSLYDMIYVDGSHNAVDVLSDGVMADLLLKPGGLLVFDDYSWNLHKKLPELKGTHPPKLAIDALLKVWLTASKYELVHKGRQVVLKKAAA